MTTRWSKRHPLQAGLVSRRRILMPILMGFALILAACGPAEDIEPQAAPVTEEDATDPAEQATGSADLDNETETSAEAWEDVVAAAQEEGELLVYTTLSQNALDLIAPAFEDEYGFPVTLLRPGGGTAADVEERIENELAGDAWEPDMIMIADTMLMDSLLDRGVLNADPGLPRASEVPEEAYSNGITTVQVTVRCAVYNTDILTGDDVPQDWDDLLDPRFDGNLGILEPENATTTIGYYYLMEKYGEDYLTQLAERDTQVWNTVLGSLNAVGAGELTAFNMTNVHSTIALQNDGAPVACVEHEESFGFPIVLGTVTEQYIDNPNAARVFQNWIMTEEGQASFLSEQRGNSVIIGEEHGTAPLPPGGIVIPDLADVTESIPRVRELLGFPPQ